MVLVGNSAAAGSAQLTDTGNSAIMYAAGYTATAGTMATAYIEASPSAGSNVKVIVWDSAGSIVGVSGAMALSGAGTYSASISGTLTATTYYVGYVSDSWINTYDVGGSTWQVYVESGNNYTTPTGLTSPGSAVNNSGKEFRIYIDGATGGAVIPLLLAQQGNSL